MSFVTTRPKTPATAVGMEGVDTAVSARNVRIAIAAGCVLVSMASGCSSRTPVSTRSTPARTSAVAPRAATSAVQDESIPGIGATRAAWDASHTPNAANNDGSVYGDDASLPEYLTPGGAVYSYVDDHGTGRILSYNLNMRSSEAHEVLSRVRYEELPSDATVAWQQMFDRCFRIGFSSATLEAAGHYLADVQLEYVQEDGTWATSPDRFNVAVIWLDEAGSPLHPEIGCES